MPHRDHGILSSRLFSDGLIESELDLNKIRTGKFSYIGEKLTAQKVISNDFDATGVCNLYLTARPLLQLSFAMIFQVIIKT